MWREAAKLCFALVSTLALASCARSGDPGTFDVRFQLEGREPDNLMGYFAFARVEKRVDGRTLVLSHAAPARLGDGARLRVEHVPHRTGAGRPRRQIRRARCSVQIRAKVSCWSSPTCKTSTIPQHRWSTQDWQRTGG